MNSPAELSKTILRPPPTRPPLVIFILFLFIWGSNLKEAINKLTKHNPKGCKLYPNPSAIRILRGIDLFLIQWNHDTNIKTASKRNTLTGAGWEVRWRGAGEGCGRRVFTLPSFQAFVFKGRHVVALLAHGILSSGDAYTYNMY